MQNQPYRIIRSKRKSISAQIDQDGCVVVRCPQWMSDLEVVVFLESKREWIDKRLQAYKQRKPMPAISQEQIQSLTRQAQEVFPRRVAYYAPLVGVTYGRITIRHQKTLWGSCSSEGNLSFNCLLMLAPPEVLDYVVVHELCHRRQMNHSPNYWAQVEKILPDYKVQRKWLKEHGAALIARMKSKE